MQILSPALPPFLLVFLHLSPAFAQSNVIIIPSKALQLGNLSFVNSSKVGLAEVSESYLEPPITEVSSETAWETGGEVTLGPEASDGYTEQYMEPSPWTTLTPGEVSSGPSDTIAQITVSNQDQNSVTSNAVVTIPQHAFKTVPHPTTSMEYQTSSSSHSTRNPFQTIYSNSTLTNHSPAHNPPTTTLAGVPVPTAVQTVLLEVIISSGAGLGDAILAGLGIVPPGASATPGETANSAIDIGVEVVQILPTTTLIVSAISSIPTAATSAVPPIVSISASLGVVSLGTSAILSGGNESSAVTANASAMGSGSTTGTGSAIVSITTTGSGNPTESASGHTSVPVVPTGGAEGANVCENWWLEFGLLVWGVGMVFWM
ncbi:hypothetical protein JMJ35_005435 [Cladonia borealis]|uniref:Uncharacterized protein n=1 Tax=Cladonia borealis TaxID=184061 RepID=A0AA39V1N6_9LECA|nr:hypothetical protein JMJ35_005435 [Cladonia borealis]